MRSSQCAWLSLWRPDSIVNTDFSTHRYIARPTYKPEAHTMKFILYYLKVSVLFPVLLSVSRNVFLVLLSFFFQSCVTELNKDGKVITYLRQPRLCFICLYIFYVYNSNTVFVHTSTCFIESVNHLLSYVRLSITGTYFSSLISCILWWNYKLWNICWKKICIAGWTRDKRR